MFESFLTTIKTLSREEESVSVWKDRSAPERAHSAYYLWAREMKPVFRERIPSLYGKELVVFLGKEWEKVKGTREHSKWVAIADAGRKQYLKDYCEWFTANFS